MNVVREGYTDFYKAVCVWNHKKNFTTFKRLFAVCGAPRAHSWKKLWFIVKNTANGRYKEIEKNFKLPIDKESQMCYNEYIK